MLVEHWVSTLIDQVSIVFNDTHVRIWHAVLAWPLRVVFYPLPCAVQHTRLFPSCKPTRGLTEQEDDDNEIDDKDKDDDHNHVTSVGKPKCQTSSSPRLGVSLCQGLDKPILAQRSSIHYRPRLASSAGC